MTPARTTPLERRAGDAGKEPKRGRAAVEAVSIDIDDGSSCWRQLECAATSEFVFLFHEWEPAIRVGIHAYLVYPGCEFDSIAPAIDAAYQRIRGASRIPWASAEPAARRVWQKLRGGDPVPRAPRRTAEPLLRCAEA